jgi:uncharacterized protein
MALIARVARRHQLAAFVVLAYAISWGTWKASEPFYLAGHVAAVPFIMLGLFGPGLAGLAVSAVAEPQRRESPRGARQLAFGAAWLAAAVLVSLDQVLNEGRPASAATVAVAAAAALVPAFVVSSIFSKNAGIGRQLASLARPAASPGQFFLALFLFAGVFALGVAISRALGLPVPERQLPASATRLGVAGAVSLTFLYTLVPNALSEEIAWRGFALPRLQARRSPLAATLALWVIWAAWHAPAYLGGFAAQSVADTVVEMLLMLPVAFVFTWIYNRAGGSLAVVGLLHPALNTTVRFLPVTLGGLGLLLALAVALVVRDRMWRAPQNGGRAGCV